MLKRLLPNVCLVLSAVALASLLQPLSYLTTFAQQGNCRTFTETGKTVCGKFLEYWLTHGGLVQQGFPISNEFIEVSELNGRRYTVQYFERSVFELHPENQPPNDVLLAQLGTLEYKRRYGVGTPVAQAPTSTPPAPPATAIAVSAATPSPAVAPPVIWIREKEYAQRNGITLMVFRADVSRKRIDIRYLIENETDVPISMSLSNADQLVADNDYNLYPPLDPGGVVRITLQPKQTYEGSTSFLGDAYYNRALALTYGINNIPNLGNVRVRIPMPPKQ